MEADGKRLYSVLTKTEVRKKMMEEINHISEVFMLSSSTATLILVYLRWDSDRAMERLSEEKEKILAKLGFLDSNKNEFNSSFADLEIRDSNGDEDDLVSTSFCSHKFSKTCWTDYLKESLQKKSDKRERVMISCPDKECLASVGPDTIKKLSEEVQEMYDDYVLASFMERNMKWCPALGCNYAIKRNDDDFLEDDDEESSDFGVMCLCGHIFCWTCQQESHRPVACMTASFWLNDLTDEAKTLNWNATNIKHCPDCNSAVQKTGDPYQNFVTCICRFRFSWLCLKLEDEHNGQLNCIDVSFPPPVHELYLTDLLNHWWLAHETMEKSKSYLKDCNPKLIKDYGLGEQDIKSLKEAGMLVFQCRLVLKWSYAFDYIFIGYTIAEKYYWIDLCNHALTALSTHEETLQELMNEANLGGDITLLKQKLKTTTRTTAKCFHSFVKKLEDALCEAENDA